MLIGTIKQIWRYPVKSMSGEQLNECSIGSLGIPGDRGWALRDETNKEITNGKRLPLLMQCAARYREQPTNDRIPQVDIELANGTVISSDAANINQLLSEFFEHSVTLWPRQPAEDSNHYRRKTKAARVFGRLARYRTFRATLPTLTRFGVAEAELRKMFSREAGEPIPDISTLPAQILEFTSPLGTYFDAFPINLLTTSSLKAMAQKNSAAAWDVRRFRPNFLIETTDDFEGLIESGWNGQKLRIDEVELRCEIPTVRCGMTTHAQAGLPKDPSVLRSIVKDANQNLGVYASVLKSGEIKIGSKVELL